VEGSTGTHYPTPDSPSDLLRAANSSKRNATSDILEILAGPGSNPAAGISAPPLNSDDAPTVITQNRAMLSGSPPPVIPSSGSTPIAYRRLGHFELIESIGAGGMAAVLKARDLELGRIVALKILPPDAARDPESVTRFKQEARAAAMLDHENVARVYYCGEDQGLHFIAFEFVEGENLRVLMDRRGTIPAADCIRYMIQVAAGLNHAAERGVVHRDIKPSNIIITPDGRAKIVDMGLARHLNSLAVNGGVTQSGVTLGTFDYISPEQALDPRQADVRSDIYSLGCTFYHAATGRPPVPEGTAAKKLYAHQHVEPLDPRLINPAIPDGLAVVLSGMMAKNPDQRYQTPTDLIAHLKGLMLQMRIGVESVPTDSVVNAVPASQTVLPEAPRLRLSWVLAASAVAVAIAAFAMTTGETSPEPVPPPWVTDGARGRAATNAAPAFTTLASSGQSEDAFPTAENVRQLAELLANPAIKKVQLGPGEFNLQDRHLKDAAIAEHSELELIGSPGGTVLSTDSAHAGLTIRASSVSIRGIRFERRLDRTAGEPFEEPTPFLAIQSASRVELLDCFFLAPDSALPLDQSVAAAFTGKDSLTLNVQGCGFARCAVALQVPARSEVTITDCGMDARTAAVQVMGKEEASDGAPVSSKVTLSRSSFMVDPRAAVVLAASPVEVKAGYCVFAALGKPQEHQPAVPVGAVLAVNQPEGLRFPFAYSGVAGHKNAYYCVSPLQVTQRDVLKVSSFEDCKAARLPVEDKDAAILAQRPWAKADPIAAFDTSERWAAFGLRIASEPAVFVDGSPTVLGAQFLHDKFSRRAYASLPVWPPDKPRAVEIAQKVWRPDLKPGEALPPGASPDLGSLLRDARSNDVILIQHNGLLPMPETRELKSRAGAGDFHITFKPAPGYTPILTTPSPAPGEAVNRHQYLFTLMSGDVAFEGLQFHLKPSLRGVLKVAAVSIASGKGCTFMDCVFTLAEDDEIPVAVVTIEDPTKQMAMAEGGSSRPVPEVIFKQCIIRGKGRGVCVEDSRAVKIDLSQTLTALDGPLVRADSGGKPVMGARSSLKMHHVTAFLGGSIVDLRASKTAEMRSNGLVPFDVHVDDCLFASVPFAGQPLVKLDGVDPSPTEAASVLDWHVSNANHYANFDDSAVTAQIQPRDAAEPKDWNWNTWLGFAHEPGGGPLGKVAFAHPPSGLKDLADMKPDDMRIKSAQFPNASPDFKLEELGATSRLPSPWSWGEESPRSERPE
jgi:serine/threonine protein kinase